MKRLLPIVVATVVATAAVVAAIAMRDRSETLPTPDGSWELAEDESSA